MHGLCHAGSTDSPPASQAQAERAPIAGLVDAQQQLHELIGESRLLLILAVTDSFWIECLHEARAKCGSWSVLRRSCPTKLG